MMRISVEVPIEDGEVIAKAIERVADAGDAAIGLEFAVTRKTAGVRESAEALPNGWRAQQADALLAIAKASLAGGFSGRATQTSDASDAEAASNSAADHHQIVGHVDVSALHGGIGRSDLPIGTIKRLTCDGSIVTVVEDARGTPLDVGRKQRTVSTPLKRALWSRDRGCTFPGCRNTRYVDAHHVRHWANGGETTVGNLMLLCSHHHRLVHEGGFTIRRDREDGAYFVRPDGRVVPRCGYRLEDMLDDFAERTENPSMEGWRPSKDRGSSSEVREAPGVYRIEPRTPRGRMPTAFC